MKDFNEINMLRRPDGSINTEFYVRRSHLIQSIAAHNLLKALACTISRWIHLLSLHLKRYTQNIGCGSGRE